MKKEIEELGVYFCVYTSGEPLVRKANIVELREMTGRTGAHSTNLESEETVEKLCGRCDDYAEHWKPAADYLWGMHPPTWSTSCARRAVRECLQPPRSTIPTVPTLPMRA